MAGGDPRIVGHVDVARFHILKPKCPRRVFTASAMVLICPGVPVTACASIRP